MVFNHHISNEELSKLTGDLVRRVGVDCDKEFEELKALFILQSDIRTKTQALEAYRKELEKYKNNSKIRQAFTMYEQEIEDLIDKEAQLIRMLSGTVKDILKDVKRSGKYA